MANPGDKKVSFTRFTLRIFGNSVVGVILSSFFALTLGAMSDYLLVTILMTFFSLTLYCTLIYSAAWAQGNKDRNYVHYNRLREDFFRGAKAGLWAMLPYVLTSVILILVIVGAISDISFIYRILNIHLLPLINLVLPAGEPMTWWGIVVVNLYHLLIPVFSGLGYYLGYKDIALGHKLIYKNKKPSEDKKRR